MWKPGYLRWVSYSRCEKTPSSWSFCPRFLTLSQGKRCIFWLDSGFRLLDFLDFCNSTWFSLPALCFSKALFGLDDFTNQVAKVNAVEMFFWGVGHLLVVTISGQTQVSCCWGYGVYIYIYIHIRINIPSDPNISHSSWCMDIYILPWDIYIYIHTYTYKYTYPHNSLLYYIPLLWLVSPTHHCFQRQVAAGGSRRTLGRCWRQHQRTDVQRFCA